MRRTLNTTPGRRSANRRAAGGARHPSCPALGVHLSGSQRPVWDPVRGPARDGAIGREREHKTNICSLRESTKEHFPFLGSLPPFSREGAPQPDVGALEGGRKEGSGRDFPVVYRRRRCRGPVSDGRDCPQTDVVFSASPRRARSPDDGAGGGRRSPSGRKIRGRGSSSPPHRWER